MRIMQESRKGGSMSVSVSVSIERRVVATKGKEGRKERGIGRRK